MRYLIILVTAMLFISCSQLNKEIIDKETITTKDINDTIIKDSTNILSFGVKHINIKFNQLINNYKVEAFWMPNMGGYDRLYGTAIISFTDKDECLFVVHDFFSLPYECFIDSVYTKEDLQSIGKEEKKIKSFAKGQTYYLDYKLSNTAQNDSLVVMQDKLPFFFADVNLDGKNELILNSYAMGQRSTHSYDVYWVSGGAISLNIQEPFIYLDAMSTIDKKNKEIRLNTYWDSNETDFKIYKMNKNGEFKLAFIEEHKREVVSDSIECWINTYKVDEKKTLIKSELVYN